MEENIMNTNEIEEIEVSEAGVGQLFLLGVLGGFIGHFVSKGAVKAGKFVMGKLNARLTKGKIINIEDVAVETCDEAVNE